MKGEYFYVLFVISCMFTLVGILIWAISEDQKVYSTKIPKGEYMAAIDRCLYKDHVSLDDTNRCNQELFHELEKQQP